MVKDKERKEQVKLGEFIICSSTNQEAFNLEQESNITGSATIHIITDEIPEPSLFQHLTEPSETSTEELNKDGTISRILIGSDNETIIEEAMSQKWDTAIWSGIIIPEVDKLMEYRKVYPVYTS